MRIAVHGDGIAAHLAGLMLARAGLDVVRCPVGNGDHGIGPVGHAVVGLPEWQASEIASVVGWVPGSAFALGIGFAGWSADRWFWPFGDTGAPLHGVDFSQVVVRVRSAGEGVDLADFSLAALAARDGRFAPPSSDPRSPLSSFAAGISCPVDALAIRLAALGDAAGVRTMTANVDAALHVDASGGARSSGAWESWRAWLPCDRIDARITPVDRPPPPYPLHIADADGWRAYVALDGAAVEAAYSVGGPGVAYENGIRRDAWIGDRVAIGSAAGIVEPALGTSLLLAYEAVERLIALLPHDPSDTRVEAAEYNRRSAARLEGVRDAAVALWATNARHGDPVWDAARSVAPPPTLARKLNLYRSRGRVPVEDDDLLPPADWALLLDGQGIRQRRLDPLAAAIPQDAAMAHVARIRARLADAVRTVPPHAAILAQLRTAR